MEEHKKKKVELMDLMMFEERVDRQRPWMMFEWVCERNSKLAERFENHGHEALRLCLPEWDLRKDSALDLVEKRMIAASRAGFQILVWISLPCRHGTHGNT